MKKTKQPGENISLKTKKTEDPLVMQWLNAQSNLMDSLRYLIEKEIFQNGVRNLQAFVPVERNVLQGGAGSALPQEIPFAGPSSGQREMAAAVEENKENMAEPGFESMHEPKQEPVSEPEEEIDDEDIDAWS
ncbi:hypothetical protein L1N85_06520 [Paenibacillus alkaliterrae]|uniref:hypothetical protein n=1 Tax=Paenibacillus alkaliterrae TaxID=320909 RepID=UPI001F1A6A88|nr:hypothetical protein [Paenibacillus alkaliterrae]MCF2938085.1 hypothetical protein [Paenibacillus alkaliterrae]